MRDSQNPLFRKVFTPWYDSGFACIVIITFTVLVLCFGGLGLLASQDYPDYQGVIWVPLLLMLMSLLVLISTIVRLIGRNRRRDSGLG
jgi:hypothetical protein